MKQRQSKSSTSGHLGAQRSQEDPTHHTRKVKDMMRQLIDHLREDVEKIDDPRAAALFETSAEVIGGLVKAFDDFERKNETAWSK